MLGALAGDIIGSRFEWRNLKSKVFELFTAESRFTDDTVHTVALAQSLLTGLPYHQLLREYFHLYPDAGYGGRFRAWASSDQAGPYQSFGNGAAMRVSPVAWFFQDLQTVLEAAEQSAAVTHDHPEGIKGAQAVAAAIFLARKGADKAWIRQYVSGTFGYDLSRTLAQIRPDYRFDVSCQGTVPPALTAFLESSDFEDAIRNAVSLGGDSDTLACITGSVAEAFYGGVPEPIRVEVWARLDQRLGAVAENFLASLPAA
ncbi:MAG: ADP-ribosylglycohydrolase family protein [Trichloromonadaceae bacterium]